MKIKHYECEFCNIHFILITNSLMPIVEPKCIKCGTNKDVIDKGNETFYVMHYEFEGNRTFEGITNNIDKFIVEHNKMRNAPTKEQYEDKDFDDSKCDASYEGVDEFDIDLVSPYIYI